MWNEAEVIERSQTDRGELVLQRRGKDFEIISNGTFLMATYNGESERRLVQAALNVVESPRSILIGGLGVGFSLNEALQHESVTRVDVFEIEPKIVEWNRDSLGEIARQSIEDKRTRIRVGDFVDWLYQALNTIDAYDVICLDIDNGSDWTVHDSNAGLYSGAGLVRLSSLLRPRGAISFWNARRDLVFEQLLDQYFEVMEMSFVEHPVGEPDVVYVVQGPRVVDE
ncbi:spermine/spermidine synthase [Alicyclobacillus curvatus]|jgi:spermidine synthase|nr:spermine/spermidine synthase [Alicyclobacillus curvatus]